jgi:Helix-turn-helix domain
VQVAGKVARMGRSAAKTMTSELRQAVQRSGMSRYAICKAIGLPQSTMSRFMAAKCGLSLATVDRLGALLGLSIVVVSPTSGRRGRKRLKGRIR